MKKITFTILVILLVFIIDARAQVVSLEKNNLEANKAYLSIEKLEGQQVVKVIKDSTVKEVDEPTFARIKGIDFNSGTIEVKVLSRLLPTAPNYARGFIGIAFRIAENNSTFEGIYLRPTNGRSDNQYMRNHSIQYFSYPGYKFDRLRKEAEGHYETYADMGLNEWITMRIEVKGKQAKLFLNDNKQPSLIVNDLKLGEDASGAIGLWVDIGTEGFFKDVKIRKD